MIHGHTKIELRNVKTGLIERVESDNVFQSANLKKWFANNGDSNIRPYDNAAFKEAPWKVMVGGLLLFRDPINAGEQFMPAGNRMTGKAAAGITNSGLPVELGSFNELDTTASASAITQVYDFNTNQANGDIACVCLTSREGGLTGYGNPSGQRYPGTKTMLGGYGKTFTAGIDYGNGVKGLLAPNGRRYYVQYNSTDQELQILEYKTNALTGSVFANLYKQKNHDISGDPEAMKKSEYFWFNLGNNKLGILPGSYSVSSGGTVYFYEYDYTTDALTLKSFTNRSSYTITLTSGSYDQKQSSFTLDGRIICWATGGFPMIFNLSDSAIVYDGSEDFSAYDGAGGIQIGPNLYIHGQSIIDATTEKAFPIDTEGLYTSGSGGYYGNHGGASSFPGGYYEPGGYYNTASALIAIPQYLATINNLQNPVTKTAAQTMKVSYTLEEV